MRVISTVIKYRYFLNDNCGRVFDNQELFYIGDNFLYFHDLYL